MEYLIKVSAILILFYTCYKLFLNRETFFESNRSFLLLGLITAFILPLITISKYIEVELVPTESVIVFGDAISQTVATHNSISLTTILTYVYLAGILFFFGRFLFQFSSLVLLFINSTKQRVASYIYVITKNALSPFSFFRWIVFNPNHFKDTELEQIITHEKVHAQQLHSIDILLVELTSILLWFNPFIWFYKKDLRQNLEFIADKNAQATTNCKKSYQHLLLKTSVPNYQIALTNNFYNSSIKKRIVMLHKNKSQKRNQLKFLLVLPALAVFLMSFNTKEVYVQAEANTEKNSATLQEAETIAATDEYPETLKTNNKPVNTSEKTVAINYIAKPNTIFTQDVVTYFIENTFTDAELDNVVTKLKTHGITLKIKGVKRNSDNEITAIKIDAKSDNSNANFSISNDSAIKTVRISYNAKSNSISIGNTDSLIHDKDHEYTHKDGVITIGKSGKSDNVFVLSSGNHDDDHEVIETDGKIIIKKGNEMHELKKERINKNKNVFVLSGGKGETFEIINADTIHADGNIFKLNGNVAITHHGNSKGKYVISIDNDKVIELKGEGDEDGDMLFIRKNEDGNIEEKVKTKGNLFTFESEDGKIFKSKAIERGEANIWISKDDEEDKTITKIGKNGGTMFFTSDSVEDSLIVIDGKEVKGKKLEDIDVDTIKSINVLKGESAEKKYGKKGKDGVIEITLKKDKD